MLRTEEKGSDVNLASYLLLDAFRGDCETTIVVSNDADLKAPIEIVKDELSIPAGVLQPSPAHEAEPRPTADILQAAAPRTDRHEAVPTRSHRRSRRVHKPSSW